MSNPTDEPIACTLDVGQMPGRLTEWQDILRHARSRARTVDGALRVELDDDVPLEALVRLVVAEQRCCSFFSFAMTVDSRGIALEVRAPDDAAGIVGSLFGEPESVQ